MTDEFLPLGLMSQVKADLVLSIRDSMRQRGLSVEAAAAATGIPADRLRDILNGRDLRAVTIETLDRIFEAVHQPWPPAPGKEP